MRFEALLFDLDGTLVDSHGEICTALAAALLELKLTVERTRVEQLVDGSSLEVIWEALCSDPRTAPGPELDFTRFTLSYREHYMRDLGHQTALYPGVESLLRALSQAQTRPRCAVVSNKQSASVQPLLARLGIAAFFDLALGCGGTSVAAKPAPDLLLSALQTLGCAPERSAMIGDTSLDILAGKRAGMITIALSHGMGTHASLVEAGADYVCDDFAQLARLLLSP
jgi:HAD superfamily hydrolase (TIGR01509 family)